MHPAVPEEDIRWLNELMNHGAEKIPFSRAIFILCRKLFPFTHDPHPWVEGKSITFPVLVRNFS